MGALEAKGKNENERSYYKMSEAETNVMTAAAEAAEAETMTAATEAAKARPILSSESGVFLL